MNSNWCIKIVIATILLMLFSSCKIYNAKNLYVLLDSNRYSDGDTHINANEVYFIKGNRANTINSIVTKKIKMHYSSKSIGNAKKFREVKRGFRFSNDCGNRPDFIKSLAKVDSIYCVYNKHTKDKKVGDYKSISKFMNDSKEDGFDIYTYYLYKLVPCSENGMENDKIRY